MFATQLCIGVGLTLGLSSSHKALVCEVMPSVVEESEKRGLDPVVFSSLIRCGSGYDTLLTCSKFA